MTDAPFTLRPTVIGGETKPEDYQVIWDGIAIGRITRQRGIPFGRPDVSWGIILSGQPQMPRHSGLASTLDEAKVRFRAAWETLLPTLTAEDIEQERRRDQR